METAAKEHFVEISLESVLRKASRLEDSLKSCKDKASDLPASPASSLSLPQASSVLPQGSESTSLVPPGPSSAELSNQWQKLTAYIVSLEKEVQYYKQLVQDVQNSIVQTQESQSASKPGHATREGVALMSAGHEGPLSAEYWKDLFDKDPESRALLVVFSFLSASELHRAALVCRKWYRVSRHPHLWKEVIMSDIMVEPEVLFSLAQWCSCTDRIILHGLMPPIASPDEDLQSYIVKTRGSLEPGLKALLIANRDSLSSLTVTECNLMATEHILWLASVHCPNLQSLTYCSDEFPPSSESLWSLANGCRHLQHLTLPPVPDSPNASWFNDNCLIVVAHAWPELVSLTIGGSSITPDGLKEIAQKCLKLEYLEVIYGPSLHKEAVEKMCTGESAFQSLTTLILNFTPASHQALQLLIENCPSLSLLKLHVTMTAYFTEVDADSVTNYSKILSNIKKLKRHRRGKEIFHLYEH